MRIRVLSVMSLVVLLFGTAAAVSAQTVAKKALATRSTNPLLLQLPESDSVALIDSRRFFDTALPKILATNQSLLVKITGELDTIQQKTSIDLRKFDEIAVGAKLTK